MLSVAHAVWLGIVEGITEFLPISSTAHLILVSNLLGVPQTDTQKSFEIIIQLGAILAVVVLYGRRVMRNWAILWRVAIAFIPTGVLGLIFYRLVKTYLLGNTQVVLWALLLGGIFLILFEYWHREPVEGTSVSDEAMLSQLSIGECLLIGTFQAFAMIPGVSRSAATVVGGLLVGIRRTAIVEFSFLLAIPTMLAAASLDIFKNYQTLLNVPLAPLGVGFLVSFVVALISIQWLLRYVRHHTFTGFGVYRIIVAAAYWFIA